MYHEALVCVRESSRLLANIYQDNDIIQTDLGERYKTGRYLRD